MAYVCLPLGVASVALGVYGDGHHWWDDRSFLTNLASSLASLLFGVPTALFILSNLGDAQAEALERRKARRRAAAEAAAFRDLLLRELDASDLPTLQHLLAEHLVIGEAAAAATAEFFGATSADRESIQHRVEQLKDHHWGLYTRLLHPESPERVSALGNWLVELRTQWEVLDQELRPRLLDLGEPWIPVLRAAEARQRMRTAGWEDASILSRALSESSRDDVVHRNVLVRDLEVLASAAADLCALYP